MVSERQMTQLSDLYNSRIMELAAAIPRTTRLAQPDATATAHSKLCGSTITVDVVMRAGRIIDFGQNVRAAKSSARRLRNLQRWLRICALCCAMGQPRHPANGPIWRFLSLSAP
jgi:hypothetical protein